LQISAGGDTGADDRIGYVNSGDTTIWDLPGAADADGNVKPNDVHDISLALTATGFTITLDSLYTSSEIAFNNSVSDFSYLTLGGHGGEGGGAVRSGHRIDDITVMGTIPEPATLGLLAAFGGALMLIRRIF